MEFETCTLVDSAEVLDSIHLSTSSTRYNVYQTMARSRDDLFGTLATATMFRGLSLQCCLCNCSSLKDGSGPYTYWRSLLQTGKLVRGLAAASIGSGSLWTAQNLCHTGPQ
jgi:hypothetical protein